MSQKKVPVMLNKQLIVETAEREPRVVWFFLQGERGGCRECFCLNKEQIPQVIELLTNMKEELV